MFNRKECKASARKNLFRHYALFVGLCLIAAVIGTQFTSSYTSLSNKIARIATGGEENTSAFNAHYQINSALMEIITGSRQEVKDVFTELIDEAEEQQDFEIGRHLQVGYQNGVLARIVNEITSGAFLLTLLSALYKVSGSVKLTAMLYIVLAFLLFFLIWVFFISVFKVVYTRTILEARIYEKTSYRQTSFLISVRKWGKVAFTLLYRSLFHLLWSLTIIGGFIKYYSYFAVPYIAAENLNIKPAEALRLSRKMMNGHKWECFLMRLSFIGWSVLDSLTFGLSGILYSNPYQAAAFCEYYVYVRSQAKEKNLPGSELLEDTCLYTHASAESLQKAYGTLPPAMESPAEGKNSFAKKVAAFFGVYFRMDGNRNFQERLKNRIEREENAKVLNGQVYPLRLLPILAREKKRPLEHLYYERSYSVWSILLMFYLFSFVGWVWEVSLHLVQDGVFVNRGVLLGPWLPIYGSGCMLILLLLNKLRKDPLKLFFSAVVLCGCVEYSSGWYLEIMHNGEKWWNYNGFFLNIDGRVCAEGLLVFGIGAVLVVYMIAPLADNRIRKMPRKAVITLCLALTLLFAADVIHSSVHPNTGNGFTTSSAGSNLPQKTEDIPVPSAAESA